MRIDPNHYVPFLKWRMGEYQALLRLDSAAQSAIVPLIIIPPREFDFEEGRLKKTTQEHIEKTPERLLSKWGGKHALIDIHPSLENETMDDGTRVVSHIFDELISAGATVVPVIGLERSPAYQSDIKIIVNKSETGVALVIKFSDLIDVNINEKIDELSAYLQVEKENIDLIIDLEKPESFLPYNDFIQALSFAISGIKSLDEYRSFVLSGTSLRVVDVKKPGAIVPRHEWIFYQQLIKEISGTYRKPTYGDYTIEPAGFAPELDMRLINPAGKIVYSTGDHWLVPKGGAFRNNRAQMKDHCKHIINSGQYMGSDYSQGDKRIEETHLDQEGYGNATTWKTVGINHHLTLVVDQLSNFHGA